MRGLEEADVMSDGGGDVDLDEFAKWWAKQDPSDTARMEKTKRKGALVRLPIWVVEKNWNV